MDLDSGTSNTWEAGLRCRRIRGLLLITKWYAASCDGGYNQARGWRSTTTTTTSRWSQAGRRRWATASGEVSQRPTSYGDFLIPAGMQRFYSCLVAEDAPGCEVQSRAVLCSLVFDATSHRAIQEAKMDSPGNSSVAATAGLLRMLIRAWLTKCTGSWGSTGCKKLTSPKCTQAADLDFVKSGGPPTILPRATRRLQIAIILCACISPTRAASAG